MTNTTTGRVRSGPGALAYLALIWTIINAIPTAVLVIAVVYLVDPPSEATSAERRDGVLLLLVVALVTAVGWYIGWRQASRSCRPIGNDLRVRGWLRVRDVPFADLIDVQDTQWLQGKQAFEFAHTLVTYREADGRARTVTVSAHFRAGQHDVLQILTWLPLEHPLRAMLPPGLRTATELPTQVPGVVRPDARVTSRLRPSATVLAIALGLLAVPIAAACVGLARSLGSRDAGRLIADVLLGIALAGLLWMTLGVIRSRIDLTVDGLVFHQVLHNSAIPVDNITGFTLRRSRAGATVMVRQLVGPDHTSLVCSGYGSGPQQLQAALQGWLELTRMHPQKHL